MKMQYKFRGKSMATGEWVYGSLTLIQDPHRTEESACAAWIHSGINIAPPEVVKFTTIGQRAVWRRNLKHIYCGDIVVLPPVEHFPYKRTGVIAWREFGFMFLPVGNSTGDYLCNYSWATVVNMEVIGNEHDNPELLVEKVSNS